MEAATDTTDGSVQRELERVLAENASLRAERDALRAALGLAPELRDSHRAPSHGSLWDDAARERLGSIDGRSSPVDKIELYASLFRGRRDVFARRWSNAETGKSGYAPAVRQGATVREAMRSKTSRLLLPMTPAVVDQHLRGNIVAGIYPLLDDDSCWLVAADFDGDTWMLDALAYLRACASASIPAALERSRSGDGGHVWIFFTEPVPAVSARRLAMQLIRVAMDERCELDLASYDRLFPSQDNMPGGGYGNLIALPLQRAARAAGNSVFLDPSTLQPWDDQWAFLAQVGRMTTADVEARLEHLPPLSVGSDAGLRRRRSKEAPAPERITCTLGARLSLERSGLPPSLVSALKHSAMLHNPMWHQRTKLRLSTHDVPRFVRCYREDLTHLHLPRGLLEKTSALVEEAGSSIRLVDERRKPQSVAFESAVELAEGQANAVKDLLKHDLGVLVAPPGAGKTRMACAAIAARGVPALVVAHTRPLLDQWRASLMENLGLASKHVGQHGGGRRRRTHVVDLATLQSLTRIDDLDEFLDGYGMLVVDECHHIPAVSFEQVVGRASVRYVLGLTATPTRRDGLQEIITMQCGPIRHRMSAEDAARDDAPPPALQLHDRTTGLKCDDPERPIQELFATLVDDRQRTSLIGDDIAAALANGRRCIVLSQWKRHCVAIVQDLIERGIDPILLHGDLGKKERARLLDQLEQTTPDQDLVVVATSQLLGEGFDCPQLDTLFLAFPISFKGRLVQYAGRLMRPHPGKAEVQVYDYADTAIPVLAAMRAKRARAFKSLGFEPAPAPETKLT